MTYRVGGCGVVVLAALMALGLGGCGGDPGPQMPPPPDVSVAHPVQKEVVEWDTYAGYLEAPESANVTARVSGLVTSMPYVEGSLVKQGEVLALIDDRPFKADLDAKIADQKKDEAALAIATLTFNRLHGVSSADAVSQQDVDNAKAAVDQAQATLDSAKAAVELAALNLEWCKVLSPIAGRVSYKLVTAGNQVTAGGGAAPPTTLTTVQSVDPIYCYVDIDENSVLKYQKLGAEGKLVDARDGKVTCYAQLGNETDFPHKGFIDFVDNHVDATTGTQRVRGVFDNKSGQLIPGLFARLCVPGSGRYEATLIPDTAVGIDQNSHNVLVVGADNKVAARPVELGALFGTMRSIVSGINVGDRVIVNGQMHARPGMAVNALEVTLKLDEQAFTDPGSGIAPTIPTTEPGATASAANPPLAQVPVRQAAIGRQQ